MNSVIIPFSAACERNKEPLQEVLTAYFESINSVLEIGSGTAQHAIHFAQSFPNLTWQTSDQAQYLQGIRSQLESSKPDNVKAPLCIDVNQADWAGGQRFSAVYTANTLHIMTQADVEAFYTGLSSVLQQDAYLIAYGPFKYATKFTSASNQSFDETLRARNCGSAIRDFEFVDGLARAVGFTLLEDVSMPANNQCLIWQLEYSPER
ncbi:MAG: cyclopropane fatty-acyl-phospholipid synthase-like methyltransferase [Cryomorphaceae bacterium]|jgi:cyclopropane fatty-acyl-phospholipid synthase-like methyltransferase